MHIPIEIDLLIILALLLLNGFFAMCELAIFSSRKARLKADSSKGNKRAQTALKLIESPNVLLATVQIGITLVGIIAGVFGGASLADDLAEKLEQSKILAPYSKVLSFGLVVVCITYLSLVFGEIIPKRLALAYPERIAKLVAPIIWLVSIIARPGVRLLEYSTEILLAPFNIPKNSGDISEEDIHSVMSQGTEAGLIEEGERAIIHRVFRLGDRPVIALMTPRTKVVSLELDAPFEIIINKALESQFSWFPVIGESQDDVLGIVSVHDLLELRNKRATTGHAIKEYLTTPLKVPESISALRLLERFRKNRAHFAVVVDEYGSVTGIVTVHDIVESLVGEIGDSSDDLPEIYRRPDGSYLVDARADIEEIWERLGFLDKTPFNAGEFHSLGGFIMLSLGHIPKTGEAFTSYGFNFEVVDMDGHRIDKVLITPIRA